MTRAIAILAKIVKQTREAEHLLTSTDDKQVMIEVRMATEMVIEAHKNDKHEKPHPRHS